MSVFFKGSQLKVCDSNGAPVSGALINTYELDGITRKTTWSDEAKTSVNTNPVVANGSGEATIVLSGEYNIVITDSLGGSIETIAKITSADQLAQQWVHEQDATYVSTTSFTINGIDVTDDYTPGRRVRLIDSSTLYGRILSSSFATNTTITVALDNGAALSASLTKARIGLLDAIEANAQHKKFKYLTGDTDPNDLVYSINNNLYLPTIDDVITVDRSASGESVNISHWELTDDSASLPGSATAGVVNSDSNGNLYVLNNGSNYYEFQPAQNSNSAGGSRNLIIGGDFGASLWQEGESFSAIANNTYAADLFLYEKSGGMSHDVTKNADAPTPALANAFTEHCLMADCVTADAALSAGEFCSISTHIEGYYFRRIARKTFVLSFWHKHTKTGTYCVSLRNSGDDKSYVAEYQQTTTDNWELATIVVPASPSGGTWDYDTGLGLKISWTLASGSTFQTTANAWQDGDFLASANQVNGCDDAANNFRIALVQCELGSVATDFEVVSPQQVTNSIYRYIQYFSFDFTASSSDSRGMIGHASSDTQAEFIFNFKAPSRNGSVSVSSAAGWIANDGGGDEIPTIFGANQVTDSYAYLIATFAGSSLTAGNSVFLDGDDSAGSFITVDARF